MAKDMKIYAALTLCNAKDGDTESFQLGTLKGDTLSELLAGVSPVLRNFADRWDRYVEEEIGEKSTA